MKKAAFIALLSVIILSCKHKTENEGSIIYQVDYQLPDTLKRFAEFLPKQALVYFKGDSTVSIQKINNESTTVILNPKSNFMRVLLQSPRRRYMIDYNKEEQAEEIGNLPPYTITKTADSKSIAGYKATKYILTDKLSQDTTEAWFTKEIAITPNYLTIMQDSALGVPLSFTVNQNGMKIKTTVKQIKFEPVPPGVFSAPKGFTVLTPQQLMEMPVDR